MQQPEQKKATQLMLRTRDSPYIRIADDLLDLEEATPPADAMYAILQDDGEWNWPSTDNHLVAWQDDRDKSGRLRSTDEEEKEYQDRLKRWNAWPERKAKKQSQWLRCAIITSRALDYLQQCHDKGFTLRGKSEQGLYYAFQPKEFYEYIWICLNQGYGTRQWKTSPPMPPVSERDRGVWFAKTARGFLAQSIKHWEQGVDLDALYPLMTWDDLLPSPRDAEAISFVMVKHKEYLAQRDEDI